MMTMAFSYLRGLPWLFSFCGCIILRRFSLWEGSLLISWKKIDRDQRSDKVSSYSLQLTGVEVEFINIGRRHLQGFMNGCFPQDSERCLVEVQSSQMPKNIPT